MLFQKAKNYEKFTDRITITKSKTLAHVENNKKKKKRFLKQNKKPFDIALTKVSVSRFLSHFKKKIITLVNISQDEIPSINH